MVDKKTETDWEKSRRIETERMKAVRAIEAEESNKANLAYLDPQMTKIKGWSRDPNVILASAERIGNRSIVLSISGVALSIVGYAGEMVTSTFNLGMAGVMIAGLPSGIGFFCMALSVLMAIIAIGSEINCRIKNKRKFGATFWSAIGAIFTVVIYGVVRWLIIRFS